MRQFVIIPIILCLFCTNLGAQGFDYDKENLSGHDMGLYYEHATSDQVNFSRTGHGAYFFAGYAPVYRMLSNATITVTNATQSISYQPKGNTPRFLQGLQVGFGAELSRRIDLQLSYLQTLSRTTNPTINGLASTIKIRRNALETNFGVVFNPDDQIQVMGTLGAMISETHETITIGGAAFYPTANETAINPAVGAQVAYFFTKTIAMRVGGQYVIDTYGKNSNGEADGFVGLSIAI